MNAASQHMELGRRFAAALDSLDYGEATKYLADDCRYHRPGHDDLAGPEAILATYHESDLKARRHFDSVEYRSEAAADESGGVRLTFFDDLRCGNSTHTFRSSQIVYFDGNQKIERIELVELPDERDRLREFCETHGIRLDPI